MKRKIIVTGDGSKTIQIEDWNEQYHSKHGAVQEAYHVFIKHGLQLFVNTEINLLEIGFGTGLNALITYLEAPKQNLKINYTGVEAYPVEMNEVAQLDYCQQLGAEELELEFEKMHQILWEESSPISDFFALHKQKRDFKEISDSNQYHLLYFDAFGARVQPDLWTEEIFGIMYTALQQGGVLVTYAAKGSVRRAMQAVGFTVERLPGPPGKREMLRATKS
ncbi:tRNA (5-methylaminomethyl-2-thiouridine)(34)-methyltransferase MnmD [Flagellimonas zhangzhouensis]|uniref:tRNA U34 5-methylaminomethyl-2-thiouridine-forming methyltransferase MnmC n=1 Tax=Flagellimonas zhangzhouensis TaxID=1073328 RepID=A0A1H2QTI2_9FLAO|nr:tRNA (5-methylaminomethyl-2-thiouridine)(34)-methyltransferase MnmD [Allomuricauda zhangzhouensis]SDQ56395.1 tRNA U34 5-methylaminomethyl-2-thiouridine-forming methyltransferase MnmC [Allomuricauda zhangzhouensis]SDW10208.1 tRNA U34 5-methylaminomethyl-2-thiouridine-forming methyltransferase MnmC [Allomuricauda zhangzhouensis]